MLYNRDPHLLKFYLGWADAWAKHAMEEVHGKPPGILPGQVAFPTGEPGGYTQNWWGAGAHEFSSLWYQTRMHEVLAITYAVTGEDRYIRPSYLIACPSSTSFRRVGARATRAPGGLAISLWGTWVVGTTI
ncbi:MAG: hypothetical protein ACUVXJ_05905 [Phycisphaerae bacterium]